MSQRHNVILPDDISKDLEQLASEREATKGEIVARAIKLYVAASRGRKEGFAVGLANPTTLELKKEFVGL